MIDVKTLIIFGLLRFFTLFLFYKKGTI